MGYVEDFEIPRVLTRSLEQPTAADIAAWEREKLRSPNDDRLHRLLNMVYDFEAMKEACEAAQEYAEQAKEGLAELEARLKDLEAEVDELSRFRTDVETALRNVDKALEYG